MARLIETSLWIDFTRAKTPTARKLVIQPWILDPDACICEPVAFEVLRHATATERTQIEAQFATLPLLPTPPQIWRDAARLGQRCRDEGLNAGSLDLVIAAITIHHQAQLVTGDADYAAIARIVPFLSNSSADLSADPKEAGARAPCTSDCPVPFISVIDDPL